MRLAYPRRVRFPSWSFEWGVLTGFLLIPLVLVLAYIWQAGLDLHVPRDSREWVKLCARGQEDIYCKTLRSVLARGVTGPVLVLYPGVTGDHDLMATLIVWKGRPPTSTELEGLARANTFLADDLKTGVVRSLDGQVHQVSCAADGRGPCRIGSLEVYRHDQFTGSNAGAIYLPAGPVGSQSFLLPRERLDVP